MKIGEKNLAFIVITLLLAAVFALSINIFDIVPKEKISLSPTGIVSTSYIYAGSLIASSSSDNPGKTDYYIQDHLGSNRKIIDGIMEKQSNDYYAFGEEKITTGDSDNDYKYTGKELDDDTGLYYYGARYYSPSIGRFIQADALRGNLEDPLSLNRYAYVRNNPLKFIDPTGNEEEKINRIKGELDKKRNQLKELRNEKLLFETRKHPEAIKFIKDQNAIEDSLISIITRGTDYLHFTQEQRDSVFPALKALSLRGDISKTLENKIDSIGTVIEREEMMALKIEAYLDQAERNDLRESLSKYFKLEAVEGIMNSFIITLIYGEDKDLEKALKTPRSSKIPQTTDSNVLMRENVGPTSPAR